VDDESSEVCQGYPSKVVSPGRLAHRFDISVSVAAAVVLAVLGLVLLVAGEILLGGLVLAFSVSTAVVDYMRLQRQRRYPQQQGRAGGAVRS